jgi:hypothetical protein
MFMSNTNIFTVFDTKFCTFAQLFQIMLKKIASILLIVTVNILLLTVSVISHHHHNGFPHFGCKNLTHEPVKKTTTPCSTDESKEVCAFEQEIIIFNKIKENITSSPNPLHPYLSEWLPALFYLFTYNFFPVQEKLLPEMPYLISYHSICVNSGMGLRAPPFA